MVLDMYLFTCLLVYKCENDDEDCNHRDDNLRKAVGFWKPCADVRVSGFGENIGDQGDEGKNTKWDKNTKDKGVTPFEHLLNPQKEPGSGSGL